MEEIGFWKFNLAEDLIIVYKSILMTVCLLFNL